jgi:hypothetical protein
VERTETIVFICKYPVFVLGVYTSGIDGGELALDPLVSITATLITESWKRRKLAEKRVKELSGEMEDLLEGQLHNPATWLAR